MSKKTEDILCVHYYYPPIRSGGVLRNYFVSGALADIFRMCHVITTDNRDKLPSEEMEIVANVSIYPVSTCDFRTILSGNHSPHTAEKKKDFPGMQWLLRIQKSFPFNLILGEGSIVYIYSGYRKGKAIMSQHNVRYIYSSAFPYADHVISFLLKRKFPEVKWIADFRDLQVEPIYKNVVFPGFQRWCEKRLLRKADLITSVSNGLTDQLKRYGRPVFSMMRGIELREKKELFASFTISYTGSMYRNHRDPGMLLKAIKALITERKINSDHIQFLYAGKDGEQMAEYMTETGIQTIYKNKGFLSREDSLVIQERSHINLVLTSSSQSMKGVITGKIFEYIEAQRPVLVIVNGTYDEELDSFIRSMDAGRVFFTDSESGYNLLKEFIFNSYRQWTTYGDYPSSLKKDVVRDSMSWHHQVSKMLKALES